MKLNWILCCRTSRGFDMTVGTGNPGEGHVDDCPVHLSQLRTLVSQSRSGRADVAQRFPSWLQIWMKMPVWVGLKTPSWDTHQLLTGLVWAGALVEGDAHKRLHYAAGDEHPYMNATHFGKSQLRDNAEQCFQTCQFVRIIGELIKTVFSGITLGDSDSVSGWAPGKWVFSKSCGEASTQASL